MKNFSALVISLFVLITPIAAQDTLDWDIENKDTPVSLKDLGNDSETIQTVRMVTDSTREPVSPANFTDSEEFEYNYSGDIGQMEYLQNGYWYADFTAHESNTSMEYQLIRSEGATTTEENLTEDLNVGNITLGVNNEFNGFVKPGESVRLRINVTDAWGNTNEENADVDAYITNGSWSEKMGDLGYASSENIYSLVVEMPEQANSSYILNINATSSGQGYTDAFGSTSTVFDTYPRSAGKLEMLEASSGCNNQSFFTKCGAGAELDAEYNMTAFTASEVEMAVKAPYENSTMNTLMTQEMNDNGLWEASFTMPELNTSKYQENISLVFNASVNNDYLVTRYNLSYATYKLSDASENSVQTTRDFEMRFSVEEPFTGNSIDISDLNEANASIYNSSGALFKSFDLEDMNFYSNSGFYGADVFMPRDLNNGTFQLNVTVWDKYNFRKSFEEPFTVGEIDSTFNTTDEIEFQFYDFLEHNKSFEVTNQKSRNLTLNVTLSDEIENITTVNDGENLEINSSSTESFNVSFKTSEISDYDGEIVLKDEEASFEEEIDVEILAPDCEIIDGRLCIDHGKWVNSTTDERGTFNRTVTVRDDREGNLSVSVQEVTDEEDFFTVTPSSFELNETEILTVQFDAQSPGNFTGEFRIETDNYSVNMWTGLDSNVESLESSIELPSSIDLGAVTRGNDVEETVEVENTGDIEVYSVSVESSTYSVTSQNVTIEPGATETATLSFTDVRTGSGQVTIVAETSRETIRSSVPVSTSLSDPFIDRNETDDDPENNFNDSLENDESENPGGSDSLNGDGSSSSSGGLLIPITAVTFILLLVGFVFFTSYVPEEGDPLYSVLGE